MVPSSFVLQIKPKTKIEIALVKKIEKSLQKKMVVEFCAARKPIADTANGAAAAVATVVTEGWKTLNRDSSKRKSVFVKSKKKKLENIRLEVFRL